MNARWKILTMTCGPLFLIGCEDEKSNGIWPLDYVFYVDPREAVRPDTLLSSNANGVQELRNDLILVNKTKKLPKNI